MSWLSLSNSLTRQLQPSEMVSETVLNLWSTPINQRKRSPKVPSTGKCQSLLKLPTLRANLVPKLLTLRGSLSWLMLMLLTLWFSLRILLPTSSQHVCRTKMSICQITIRGTWLPRQTTQLESNLAKRMSSTLLQLLRAERTWMRSLSTTKSCLLSQTRRWQEPSHPRVPSSMFWYSWWQLQELGTWSSLREMSIATSWPGKRSHHCSIMSWVNSLWEVMLTTTLHRLTTWMTP